MPNAPDKRDQHNALEVPKRKSRANHYEENRRENESPSKTLKQGSIAVRANHTRQVVTHCAESSNKKVNVFRAPESLRSDKDGHQTAACIRRESGCANCPESTSWACVRRLPERAQPGQFAEMKTRGRTACLLAKPSFSQIAAKINPEIILNHE